jgi:hypothetical protein
MFVTKMQILCKIIVTKDQPLNRWFIPSENDCYLGDNSRSSLTACIVRFFKGEGKSVGKLRITRILPDEGDVQRYLFLRASRWSACLAGIVLTFSTALPAKIKSPRALSTSSNIELAAPLAEVVKAVELAAVDPIVHGTYVYERDKTLTGAHPAVDSSAFGNAKPQGRVFYKVAENVIAPRHFKATEDMGTITVRYLVQAITPTSTSVRVDAIYIESAHRAVHPSEGAVESAEFGEVQLHLNRILAQEKDDLDEAKDESKAESKEDTSVAAPVAEASELLMQPAAAVPSRKSPPPASSRPVVAGNGQPPAGASDNSSVGELEERVKSLRHQVEARVKAPGAPLKSAPFHTATTIQTVPGESEVAIVILTTYWYGVQTPDGHRGWIQRSQLEPLP